MPIPYARFSSAGNTFYLIDNRHRREFLYHPDFLHHVFANEEEQTDGLILLEHSAIADLRMRIFNSDGSEAEMCGNGLRALVRFAFQLGIELPSYTIESNATVQVGLHYAKIIGSEVKVSMGAPHDFKWNQELIYQKKKWTYHFLNTGVPHAIFFLSTSKELEAFSPEEWGPFVRYHAQFSPQGTNVNWAVIQDNALILARTYERGVERETLACGTGVTATALAAAFHYNLFSPIQVKVRSNDILTVSFEKSNNGVKNIFLQGPALEVKKGHFLLPPSLASASPS